MDEIIIKEHIPQIEELQQILIDITSELFVAEYVLLHDQAIRLVFDKVIYRKVCVKIFSAVRDYKYKRQENGSLDPKETELWPILYPSLNDHKIVPIEDDNNLLGAGIVDDQFNKLINDGFNKLYGIIEDNMPISKKVKVGRNKRIKKSAVNGF